MNNMNKKRRSSIVEAICLLDRIDNIISNVLEQEEDSLENIPDGLQDSERYEKMENAASHLEDAISGIEEVRANLEEAAS